MIQRKNPNVLKIKAANNMKILSIKKNMQKNKQTCKLQGLGSQDIHLNNPKCPILVKKMASKEVDYAKATKLLENAA